MNTHIYICISGTSGLFACVHVVGLAVETTSNDGSSRRALTVWIQATRNTLRQILTPPAYRGDAEDASIQTVPRGRAARGLGLAANLP